MLKHKRLFYAMSMSFLLAFSIQALADTTSKGWIKSAQGWQYVEDGAPIVQEWRKSGSEDFYLGSDGLLVTNTLLKDSDNDIFFLNESGVKLKNTWRYVVDPYTQDGFHWFYFGSDGKANVRKSSSDKASFTTIDDRDYLFDENGHMLTGWIYSDGSSVPEDSETGWKEAPYYLGDDGAVSKGWRKISVTDANDDGSTTDEWFYFDSDGKKTTKTRKTVTGRTYTFDSEDGHMLTGFTSKKSGDVDSSDDTLNYMTDAGQMVKNKFVYAVPNQNYDQDDYDDSIYSWWYFDANGNMVKNKIRTISKKKYGFDTIGRMLTGFAIKNSDSSLSKLLDTDESTEDLSESTFLSGKYPVVYYFNEQGSSYGQLKTGYVSVNLAEGSRQFYFDKLGQGITDYNQNIHKFTISGMILKADKEDDDAYAGIKVSEASDNDYTFASDFKNILSGSALKSAVDKANKGNTKDTNANNTSDTQETVTDKYVLVDTAGNIQKSKTDLKNNGYTYTTDQYGVVTKMEKAS